MRLKIVTTVATGLWSGAVRLGGGLVGVPGSVQQNGVRFLDRLTATSPGN